MLQWKHCELTKPKYPFLDSSPIIIDFGHHVRLPPSQPYRSTLSNEGSFFNIFPHLDCQLKIWQKFWDTVMIESSSVAIDCWLCAGDLFARSAWCRTREDFDGDMVWMWSVRLDDVVSESAGRLGRVKSKVRRSLLAFVLQFLSIQMFQRESF